MDLGLVFYAFSAGMVATINPCGFAMLPAYVSYILATGDAASSSPDGVSLGVTYLLGRALLVGGTLTAGFLLLFALAGTLISLGAYILVTVMPWIGLLIGAALMLLGGWLLLGNHLVVPGLPQVQARRERSLRDIFIFGMAYGLASLSCTLPIFLIAVGSAFTAQGVGAGLTRFLAYGLGMGVVLMSLTMSLALFEGVLVGYLRRLLPYMERAGAVLLLGAGAYIVYYWLTLGQLLRTLG
jgi:cytochrome c biogenesis protein CcdA